MSKFTDALELHATRHRVPLWRPPEYLELSDEVAILPTESVYEIRAKFGAHVSYPDGDIRAAREARKHARAHLAEAVFGEFREDIIKARHLVWAPETKKREIADLLTDILERMFPL